VNDTSGKTERPTAATSDSARAPRFRALLALAITVLVVAVVGAATLATAVVLDRSAREALRSDLRGAEQVFAESWTQRRSVLRSEVRVVAEEPRLKAVTAAEDVGRDTMVGVLLELHQAVASDLFVLTDADGRLILDAADPAQSGQDLGSHEVVREALAKGDASGIWTSGETVFQVQAQQLAFGETPFGVLVLGYSLGSKVVDSLERQVGARTVIELDGAPVVVSNASKAGGLERAVLGEALSKMPSGDVHELDVGGARYLALAGELPGYSGKRKLRYALLRSLDQALAPALSVRRVLIAIALCAVGLALISASLLSRTLSRPLEALVGLTKQFAGGKLQARAVPSGPRETRLLGESLNQMAADLESVQRTLRQKDRLERELEIAERIQTALLPQLSRSSGLELAARMVPAATVGGDYYDFHPVPGGAWIGVGDVAGHGLTAGLIMVMVQSGVSGLVRALPDAHPSRLVNHLNEVVFSNVHQRLGESEHVTFSLLRYFEDGRIVHAGAHEDMIVYRRQSKRCEVIRTRGLWLGALPDSSQVTRDSEFKLEAGDVLVLYSDGIIEALDPSHRMYGLDRLLSRVTELGEQPVPRIVEAIFEDTTAFSPMQDDDRTVVVLRHVGGAVG
jgi:phosphoserine phosphatase RsbU/P